MSLQRTLGLSEKMSRLMTAASSRYDASAYSGMGFSKRVSKYDA